MNLISHLATHRTDHHSERNEKSDRRRHDLDVPEFVRQLLDLVIAHQQISGDLNLAEISGQFSDLVVLETKRLHGEVVESGRPRGEPSGASRAPASLGRYVGR